MNYALFGGRLSNSLLSNKPKPVRAFSDTEVAFLAPLISERLRQAASDQQIGFTLIHQHNLFSHRGMARAVIGSSAVRHPRPLTKTVRDRSLSTDACCTFNFIRSMSDRNALMP